MPDINVVSIVRGRDQVQLERPAEIGDGGNSGFQALNLAAQFGARRICLVGYDMRLDRGVHWHGRHRRGLNNPTDRNLVRWRRALDGAAPVLAALGIEVVNCSPVSTLTAYPVMSLDEALRC